MLQFRKSEEKEQDYKEDDIHFRIQKIQQLIKKQGLDGLLVINGVDSKRNGENEKMSKWLIGFNGHSIVDEWMEEVYDEMVIMIQENRMNVYIVREQNDNKEHKYESPFLIQMLRRIPNVEIYEHNDKGDKETGEIEKIAYFVKMVEGVQKVGVLGHKSEKSKKIEQWPLLQAYGLEGTCKGFFGQSHQIFNMTLAIEQLYRQYDRQSLQSIPKQQQTLWFSIERTINDWAQTRVRDIEKIEDHELSEILKQQYYLQEVNNQVGISKPFDEPYIKRERDIVQIENVDLNSKLRVARSYFDFQSIGLQTVGIEEVFREDIYNGQDVLDSYRLVQKENEGLERQKVMVQKYIRLKETYDQVLEQIQPNNMNQGWISSRFKSILGEQVEVWMQAYNSYGEVVNIDQKDNYQFKLSGIIFYMKVKQDNLIYGDSFIMLDSEIFNVTGDSNIMKYVNSNKDIKNVREKWLKIRKRPIEQLGQIYKLFQTDNPQQNYVSKFNRIVLHYQISQKPYKLEYQDVGIQIYEYGLVIDNQVYGFSVIKYQQMKNIVIDSNNGNIFYELQTLDSMEFMQIGLKHKDILQIMLEQLKSLGIQYSYDQIKYKQEDRNDRMQQLFRYLQYKQTVYFHKNIKQISSNDYFQPKQEEKKGKIVIVKGNDIDNIGGLGIRIQQTLKQQLKQECGLINIGLDSKSYNQSVQQIMSQIDCNQLTVVVVPTLMQSELQCLLDNQLLLVVTKLSPKQEKAELYFQQNHGLCIPGFNTVLLVDQKNCRTDNYDRFIHIVRQVYPQNDIIRMTNDVFNQSMFLEVLEKGYCKQTKERYEGIYRNISDNQKYGYVQYRLPVNQQNIKQVFQNEIMNDNDGYWYQICEEVQLEKKEEREQKVEVENKKKKRDELAEQMEQL